MVMSCNNSRVACCSFFYWESMAFPCPISLSHIKFSVSIGIARTTYAKVAGKYQDVLTLEQSVAELHQMFLDFALLTEQQGELLDQIEFQVTQANDYVEEANIDVNQAIEYQKAIRKKQWYVSRRNLDGCTCTKGGMPYCWLRNTDCARMLQWKWNSHVS